MFHFRPALWRDGTLYELPRPITSLRVQDAWDFARFKVPLQDGDWAVGHSSHGVDVAIEGRVGSHSGQLRLSEAEMFETLEQLRTELQSTSAGSTYELFLYHDVASGIYRSLRRCHTVRFEFDLTDPHLFTYSAVIHAGDAQIYTEPPG